MNTISANWKDRSHRAVIDEVELGHGGRKLGSWLRAALRALWHRAAAARRYAAARREFARLDDPTLRDLGISRSEFDSYWAESVGLAERSRVRVMQQFDGSLP
ncbi:MAG TPA: DUF1127 domain-containing protein [Ramlibacter sp.]|nr:DUF1127 domain-containing protein [Ramlibacter sp.]